MSTSEKKFRLHVVVASTRPGRVGPQVANWFVDRAVADGEFEVRLVDLAEVGLPLLDEPEFAATGIYVHEHTRRWSEIVSEADAIVFVMPEYNGGFTAPLKNALDYLLYEWKDKPVGLVSYGMSSGGMRAAHMIKPVLLGLGMVPVGGVILHLRQVLNAEGELVTSAALDASADDMLGELARVTPAFAALREVRSPVAG
ncbi:NAD(P)H-dependent oxidoreductase [Fodinicola feengrottensis]|uniref:NAD(P)H-dependent oxidoreductase n=1 Tax=Fodinicola feengrottensis TaxID=435914 RepID=A0ABN2GRR8_9ACTN